MTSLSIHTSTHFPSLLDGFQCLSLKDKCFKKKEKTNTQLKLIITPETTLDTLKCQ